MRAEFEDINTKKGDLSFYSHYLNVPLFPFKWHYHPEYELTLILKGSGKRLVGDSYEKFEDGDLVLIGPNIPHTWASTPTRKNNKSSAIVIQFHENFIDPILRFNESRAIRKLLHGATYGYSFSLEQSKKVADHIKILSGKNGVEKIAMLLVILDELSSLKPKRLASEYFTAIKGEENERRINKVCQHIQKCAKEREKISLQSVASLIHLSDAAFCKFFKRATGQTFSDYVNDVRIGNACFLLNESDKTVAEIAYECGFESLTYFNRIFMKKKQVTPRDFRKRLNNSGQLTVDKGQL